MVVDEPGQMTRICSSRHFVEPDIAERVSGSQVYSRYVRLTAIGKFKCAGWEFALRLTVLPPSRL